MMKVILSLDGGGIRGLFSAYVLQEIQKRLDHHILQKVDMIAGTSTGGIMASALSIGDGGKYTYSVDDVVDLYVKNGKEIFTRSVIDRINPVSNLCESKYESTGIERVLKSKLKDRNMNSTITPLFITSYDIEHQSPYLFKSWKDECKDIPIWKAARASSAAPTYFQPMSILIGGEHLTLVDGGLFANNPSMSAYAEAKRMFSDEDILVISIGTGSVSAKIDVKNSQHWGMIEWISPLLDSMFEGMSDATDYQMVQFIGDRYLRVQTEVDIMSPEMDDVGDTNFKNIKRQAEKYISSNGQMIDAIVKVLS